MLLRWLPGDPFALLTALVAGALALRLLTSRKSILHQARRAWRWAEDATHAYQQFAVPERLDGVENPLFRKSMVYVSSLPSLEEADAASVSSSATKTNDFALQLSPGHAVRDCFLGGHVSWTFFDDDGGGKGKRLLLRVRRQDRTRVLRPYLQHVEAAAEEMERRRRELRLFTNSGANGAWAAAPFTHSAAMETVAMDPGEKNRVATDLEAFVRGRGFYQRVGRVWRRSYLLFGPRGTGKSTFAAAMARFIGYDVYSIDVARCADLRALVLQSTPRSLVLVEDIDKYLEANMGGGVMSFMDGVESCCGEERVLVFTMSVGSKDAIDHAVLRPGRIDVQMFFPMCDFPMFKMLADSYLGVVEHKLFPQVEESFAAAAAKPISPAEVCSIMLANRGSPSRALRAVIGALSPQAAAVTQRASSVHRTRTAASGELGLHDAMASGVPTPVGSPLARNIDNGGDDWPEKRTPVREFKKLYGIIKIKSRRDSGVVPVEMESPTANGRRTLFSPAKERRRSTEESWF